MSKKDKAAPKTKLAEVEIARDQIAKDARQRVKARTDELLDDDEFGSDIDFDDEALIERAAGDGKLHISARRKLEDYLEEKRLRMDIEDDFDM